MENILDEFNRDADGKEIKRGAIVEVVEEEKERKGNPKYEYCSVGKQGQVAPIEPGETHNLGGIVHVEFKTETGEIKGLSCWHNSIRVIETS